MSKLTLITLAISLCSSFAYSGEYSNNLEGVYKNVQKRWAEVNLTNEGGFRGIQTASLKNSHLWEVLLKKPSQVNYLKADNVTYRLKFNESGPVTAQLLRSSPDANLKGYLVGY